MSLVLPLPLPPRSPRHYPKSRASTPGSTTPTSPSPTRISSRPCTPPPQLSLGALPISSLQPISAPSTPVTATHIFPGDAGCKGMERCRSSESVMTQHLNASGGSAPGQAHPHVPSPLHNEASPAAESDSSAERSDQRDRGGRGRAPKATSLLFHTVPSKEQIADLEGKAEWAHVESPSAAHTPRLMPVANAPSPTDVSDAGSEGSPAVKHVEVDAHGDERMDVDEPELPVVDVILQSGPPEPGVNVWGMPRWGWEDERKEVRKGVRLVGMEELPGLIDQHAMLDVPSCVLFPWLHGISDDGQKGRDMAAFFGRAAPFEPPPYRGLSVLLCPPHPLDEPQSDKARGESAERIEQPHQMPIDVKGSAGREPRERSETMSTSSESYISSRTGTTEATSLSVADFDPCKLSTSAPLKTHSASESKPPALAAEEEETPSDVQMHPLESKRVTAQAVADGLADAHHPLPCEQPKDLAQSDESSSSSSDESAEDDDDEHRPTSLLLNALHVQDIFDLPTLGERTPDGTPRFRPARLPNQINLRNLNIQQIKYATISDIVLYAKHGVGNGVLAVAEEIAQAQEQLWQQRMRDFYSLAGRSKDEVNEPVRYGVWVLVEPFHKVEKFCPHLVNLDYNGHATANSRMTDLFEREVRESQLMTQGSEVVEGFWVGNDCDVPGGSDDGAGASVPFDLCVKASECSDMPSSSIISWTHKKLLELDQRKQVMEEPNPAWTASPATIALRNLLSPSGPSPSLPETGAKRVAPHAPDGAQRRHRRSRIAHEYVSIECAGSCRTITGQMRSLSVMTDRVIELVYFLRKIIEGRDKSGVKRQVLVHCQDGYTESSIIALAYIMSSLSISLPEAFLHLQNTAKRSFFLYPSDKPLLRKVDARLAADRRNKALKLISSPPPSPSATQPSSASAASTPASSRWRAWGFGSLKNDAASSAPTSPTALTPASKQVQTAQAARQMLLEEEKGGSAAANEAKIWFDDRRFDGFPSRILPFLYLGNLEHAGNAAMLHAIGVTHVVSVGESLIGCHPDCDPAYGNVNGNSLAKEYTEGRISVLDLCDIRDDGNDPLRPLIARAVEWMEEARKSGGTILVHCRVGVSRSASIVIAYLMKYQRLGLMDAYLLTRARRLNVLIQPNLRFFHELFGWEVELAREEEEADAALRDAQQPLRKTSEVVVGENYTTQSCTIAGKRGARRIMYSWPAFCRDLHCLNRRFLCN